MQDGELSYVGHPPFSVELLALEGIRCCQGSRPTVKRLFKLEVRSAELLLTQQGAEGMSDQSICAVIVTYHPSARMVDKLSDILVQVQGLVVVDNNSAEEELRTLRAASQDAGFQLIENEENLGIAAALNHGIQWAIAKGYQWVILLDQDSTITDEFVSHLFATWESHPERERVCSIHPKYIDPDTGQEALVRRAEDGGPIISMTSGALMPTWVFTQLGWFASDLFIDEVDTEYCLRIRASGYLVIDSREAVLLHTTGHSQGKVVLGFRFRPSFHSPMRRYYMARNRVVVYRRYFRRFPRWILLFTIVSLRETIKCLLAEPDRARKLRNMVLGTWDGLTGQMGRRDGL